VNQPLGSHAKLKGPFVRAGRQNMQSHALNAAEPIAPTLAKAFAPVHKSALGAAAGIVFGAFLAGLTVFHVVARPSNALEISLLSEYFYGYSVSWIGAGVALFWGFLTGFVAGWFVAFIRNFTTAVWLVFIRAKAALSQPFLDHI
jgi:hypothetical protein